MTAAPLLTLAAGYQAAALPPPVQELTQAWRTTPGAAARQVSLPDWLPARDQPARSDDTISASYRLDVDLGPAPTQVAVYLSGVFGHPRIAFNGVVIQDSIRVPLPPPPRGVGRLRLVDIPEPYLRSGINRIDITLMARGRASLSTVRVGASAALRDLRDRKAFGLFYGPGLVSAIIGCLGASVLLLYLRRPTETMFAYFGGAALAWGLHTLWSILPVRLLVGLHEYIWWLSLYSLVVMAMANFALRFAGYHWRRVEKGLWTIAAAAPVAFYLADSLGLFNAVEEAWRLGMVAVASGGMGAVAVSAWRRRGVADALLALAGIAAASLGLADWVASRSAADNLPVTLVPWAGLPFVMVVTWFLIDRFVRATESLESINRDLEARVERKSAELASALDAMRLARDEAQAANQDKSRFLAAASHDLRQPMQALGLYMAALRGRQATESQRDLIERMEASVTALESMFDSLLDISRMDVGAVQPRPAPFDLGALLERVVDDFAAEADAQGLRLALRVAPAARSLRALTDSVLLERVLRNLISNALKYTQRGGVLVTCRLRGANGPAPRWRIEVWDTGQGIAAHEQARVFDEFYQVGNPERNRRSGLGLGLSVVRRLADRMGLPLMLTSRLGFGTRFGLEVPATPLPAQLVEASAVAGSVVGLCVAVIDDDPEVRDSMLMLLQDWGCRVVAGADAADIATVLQSGRMVLDAVVADLRLRGDRDGLAAVERLRQDVGRDLPVLLISGDTAPERVALMQGSGLPWLNKPVPPARLRSWLATVAVLKKEPT